MVISSFLGFGLPFDHLGTLPCLQDSDKDLSKLLQNIDLEEMCKDAPDKAIGQMQARHFSLDSSFATIRNFARPHCGGSEQTSAVDEQKNTDGPKCQEGLKRSVRPKAWLDG